jgi:hypothetical protein
MAVLEKRTNLERKRKKTIKNPHKDFNAPLVPHRTNHKDFNAPLVPHRTKITPENKRQISIAKYTRELLQQFRDQRALESYTDAIEYLISQIHNLERLILVLKRINDLAVEKDDVKFLIYGLNKKMPPDLDITFREVVQRYKNG